MHKIFIKSMPFKIFELNIVIKIYAFLISLILHANKLILSLYKCLYIVLILSLYNKLIFLLVTFVLPIKNEPPIFHAIVLETRNYNMFRYRTFSQALQFKRRIKILFDILSNISCEFYIPCRKLSAPYVDIFFCIFIYIRIAIIIGNHNCYEVSWHYRSSTKN